MQNSRVPFAAACQTTAMGIMPHTDMERALKLAFSLDIPFWPQLPNTSFYEDMYVQASEGFPGITVDTENKKLHFDRTRFDAELGSYSERMNDPRSFELTRDYSVVFHRFLGQDLSQLYRHTRTVHRACEFRVPCHRCGKQAHNL